MKHNENILSLSAALLCPLLACASPLTDGLKSELSCWDDDLRDYVPVPERHWNAFSKYEWCLQNGSCTTNQLIDALYEMATNIIHSGVQDGSEDYYIALNALNDISMMDCPYARDVIKICLTNEASDLKWWGAGALYRYSQLEQEVFDYFRIVYSSLGGVAYEQSIDPLFGLEDSLETMGDEGRVAATNRLARFEYFMVTNATCKNILIDRHLCALKPDYAQSRQRLAAMSVVASATTNAGGRVQAQAIVDTLSLVPTNELNDVSWLTDE